MNKMGPSTEHCGTPYELVNGCDKEEFILIEEVLFETKEMNQLST